MRCRMSFPFENTHCFILEADLSSPRLVWSTRRSSTLLNTAIHIDIYLYIYIFVCSGASLPDLNG